MDDLFKIPVQFSTADFAVPHRTEAWREIYGRTLLNLRLEPDGADFESRMTLRALPDLGIASGSCSAATMVRTPQLADSDDYLMIVNLDGRLVARQESRDAWLGRGQATLVSSGRPGTTTHPSPLHYLNLRFSYRSLAPSLARPDDLLATSISADAPALRLLVGLVQSIPAEELSPELARLVSGQVHDLAALALGATRDAVEQARGRGVRAARLATLKRDIGAQLTSGSLSVETLARDHQLSPGYIRSLFRGEETTFRDYVLGERLVLAHAILTSAKGTGRMISTIAYDCGFGDLSYFNHSFRARYGMAPGEAREQARRADLGLD